MGCLKVLSDFSKVCQRTGFLRDRLLAAEAGLARSPLQTKEPRGPRRWAEGSQPGQGCPEEEGTSMDAQSTHSGVPQAKSKENTHLGFRGQLKEGRTAPHPHLQAPWAAARLEGRLDGALSMKLE